MPPTAQPIEVRVAARAAYGGVAERTAAASTRPAELNAGERALTRSLGRGIIGPHGPTSTGESGREMMRVMAQ